MLVLVTPSLPLPSTTPRTHPRTLANMRILLFKDPSSQPGEILAHVQVSASDDPAEVPAYSHSFRYKVPSGKDGEVIVYTNIDTASKGGNGDIFSFDLEKCRNKKCKEKNPGGCPAITGKTNRLLVADVFHTMPTQNTLQYFGTALFKALFSSNAGRLLEETEPTDPNGGIFLQLNKHDGDLDAIPWEYAKNGTKFLVHSHKFARVLAHTIARPQYPLPKLPLRIVVVVPDPSDLTELSLADLHLGDQFQNFINEFRGDSINVMLERVLPATVNRMNSLLAKNDDKMATVLHFMGHCVAYKDDKRARGLLFEDDETFKCIIANTQSLVTVPRNLRLAFLSACDSREVARDLAMNGIRHAIGSYCPLPDDIARKSEAQFYRYLAQGLSVDEALWRTRMNYQHSEDPRQNDYLAGALILYSTNCQTVDNIFLCESGELKIELNMFPNNLNIISSPKKFFGRKEQLTDLNDVLRRMATRTNDSFDLCTITGIGGQGKTILAKEAIHRTGHFFPGGIFVWQFDDKKEISARDYLRGLAEVLFPKYAPNIANEVEILRQDISDQFKASSLLILDHADTLTRAAAEAKEDALFLVDWLQEIISRKDIAVKILATAQENLGWLGESPFPLDGLTKSDIHNGCRLFVENLNPKAKVKIQTAENSKLLLRELVMRMDGHPLSLKLLGDAAGLPKYLDKPLKDIVYEHYDTMFADSDAQKKQLQRSFKPKIERLTEMERLFLFTCSLFAGPITVEILALVYYFVNYNEEAVKSFNYSIESITKSIEQFCKDGYFLEENEAYKIHVGFKEGLRQLNDELNIGVYLPKIGLVDAFIFGIPSKRGKSNVLEWQLRNMQNNSSNKLERTYGIQYHDIVNNSDVNDHEQIMSFRGLVVFTCEASKSFLDGFAELSAKQIKPIVEERELPFILCFKHTRTKLVDQTIEIAERKILLKRAMNFLQDNLRATHLIIMTEPFPEKLPSLSSTNANIKNQSAKPTFKKNLSSVHTYGDFVGRGKELKQLKELLDDNTNNTRYITILGFGGMGKTSLAIQAVKNFNFEKVLVLSFVNNPTFNSMISKIAEFLSINIKDSNNVETDVLEKLEVEDMVLFYLDNMETLKQAAENKNFIMEKERKEAESIFRFFNETPVNVKILATSRVVLGWPGERLIRLTGLEPQEGMHIFQQWASQRLKDFTDEDAKNISNVANGHPLSIRLLGGAFNKCKRPINEFISNITEQLMKAKDSLDRRYDSIDTCIQCSYDCLDETLKHLLGQLRRFNVPFSATLVSKALRNDTTSSLTSASPMEDDLHILWQQSWLNTVDYIPTLGDWRPRFMESDVDFYTLHPRLRDFLDHEFSNTKVTDFDDRDIQFYTALCYAVGFGVVNDLEKQIEWCRKAAKNGHLEAQLSLAACYKEGACGVALDHEKALHWYLLAAEAGDKGAQWEVVKHYYSKGDIEKHDAWFERWHVNRTEPLEIKFDFILPLVHRAAENNQGDLIATLIKNGSVKTDVKDRQGQMPLHFAARKGHIEVVKLLAIEFNAVTNAMDRNGMTPLYVAAMNGHIEVVQLLVTEFGADVNDGSGGMTPLHAATSNGHIEVVRLLVAELGADIRAVDKDGRSLLHVAAAAGIDVFRLLVDKLGDDAYAIANSSDHKGTTPLHSAAENGHIDVMRMLMAVLGADKDKKDNNGGTLLHYAAKGSHMNVLNMLLAELGADVKVRDIQGWTPLLWAVNYGHGEALQLLMSKELSTELSFFGNKIGAAGACALAESLKQNTTLTQLGLGANLIGNEGASALGESLKHNTTLTRLELYDNKIGVEGVRVLGESLKQNTTLTQLGLGVNDIGNEGACALGESLKLNTTLTQLELYRNNIGDEGACALAELLKHNTTLTILSLRVNNIGNEGARALGESLRQNTALTQLGLGLNMIGAEGARGLGESLKQNTTLNQLILFNNNIGNEGACALGESLKQNTILTKLDIGRNDIGANGARALVESLKQNTTLTYLELQYNNIDDEGAHALAESLNRNKAFTKLSKIMDLCVAEYEAEINTTNDKDNCTQLHMAELHNTLTEFGKDLNANGGLTPLHVIVAHGNIELLKFFAGKFGADANHQDNNGWTPLHMAAARGYDEVVKLLVTVLRANPNAKDNDGRTPLHKAADNGHVDVVKLLATEYGADITARDNGGYTLLHWATHFGHINVIKLLATEFKMDINAKDNNGWAPLHCIAQVWLFEIMSLLVIEFGPDANAEVNANQTSLGWAAMGKKVEIIKIFVPEFATDVTVKAKVGPKAIHYLERDWYVKVAKMLVAEHGANVNVNVNTNVEFDWYFKANKLLNIDPMNGGSEDDNSPYCRSDYILLHWAAREGHVELVRLLVVDFGVDPNIKNNDKVTALHLASWKGHINVVKLLVEELRADINSRSDGNATPLQLAEQRGHVEVVRIITKLLDSDGSRTNNISEAPIDGAITYLPGQLGHQNNTAAPSEIDIKLSEGARNGTENFLLEESEELDPSSNGGDSGRKSQKRKEPQRESGDDGLIWKTTVAVVSVGSVICIAWLLWGRMGSRRRLRR